MKIPATSTATLVLALSLALAACNAGRTDSRTVVDTSLGTGTGAIAGVGAITRVESAPAPNVAPVFSWKDVAGNEHSLEDYRGKVVLVNFWGTWCPPCRRELPGLAKIRKELGTKQMEIIGINVGEQPRQGKTIEENVAAFASSNSIGWPLVIASDEVVTAYGGIEAVPTTFVIDRDGKIAAKIVGARAESDFREAIEAAGGPARR